MANYKTFGPRAYTEADAEDFKGRESAIKGVMNLMQTAQMTTIYAMSGDGKSSLIQAGLYPKMRERKWFPIEIVFSAEEYKQKNFFLFDAAKGCTPFEEWVAGRIAQEAKMQRLTSNIANDISFLCSDGNAEVGVNHLISHSLWWILRTMEFSREEADCLPHRFLPVLVFDQFEKVINSPDERAWTDGFFRSLEEATKEMPPQRLIDLMEEQYNSSVTSILQATRQLRFKMLFALRKEYIGAFDYWIQQEYYVPALCRNRYCLLPLNPEDAQAVADYRILTSGQEISETKMVQLINSAKESEGENKGLISPLILSILLDELGSINGKDFEDKMPEDILRIYYERQLKQTGLRRGEINILENALVDNSGRRRPYLSIEDERLAGLDLADTVLMKMDKDLHLIHCVNIHGKNHIELVHDRLAVVVNERRKETKKKRKVVWGSISCILAFSLISLASVHLALHRTVVNTWADSFACLATIEHDGIWITKDILNTQGAGKIDEVVWNEGDTIDLEYMGYLRKVTIDVENPVFRGFMYCPRLREIKFTDKVKTIKGECFIGELGERMTIWIGDSLKPDNLYSFLDYLDNDTKFVLSPNNPYLKQGYAYDNGGFSFGEYVLKDMLWEKSSKEILFLKGYQGHFPAPANYIFPEEFKGNKIVFNNMQFENEEKRSLADQLTYAGRDFETFTVNPVDTVIGMYAFMKCKKMKSVTLNNVTTIESEAFGECTSLESIDLRKVKNLYALTFNNCFGLKNVMFPEDSISLGAEDFNGCLRLKEIKLPKVIFADCRATFRRCINLETVYLPDTIITNDSYSKEYGLPTMFSYCPKLKHFVFSAKSHFNWREDSVLYYEDTPAFFNLCTNPNWCAKDSSYYFKDGLLYDKDGTLIDACAGVWKREGCYPQSELFLHNYFKSCIGGTRPYPFYPSSDDTAVDIPSKARGTFAIINPVTVIKKLRLPYAEPKTVGIDLTETFASPEDITLVVPWHRRDAYESDPIFQQYGKIVEESFCATAWQIVKNDVFEFFKTTKKHDFLKPLTSPLVNWLFCPILVFTLIVSMSRFSKIQPSNKMFDGGTLFFVIMVFIFWLPIYFLLFHFFAFYTQCNSLEKCLANVCMGEVVISLCATLVYLQFIKTGVLSAIINQLKKKIVGICRKM